MFYVALALYFLAWPLAGMVALQSFNEQTQSNRALLGLEPRRMTVNDKVAASVATMLWPVLGVICYVAMVFGKRKRP